VAAEFSVVAVRRSRINQLVQAGDIPARTVQRLHERIERLLSTTQLGITLSSLALGWIGEQTVAHPIRIWMQGWPLPEAVRETLVHSLAVPLAFFAIAYLQIVLGELCPKSVALLYAEQMARILGPFSLAIAQFFNPFIWVLNQSTRLLLRLGDIQYSDQAWYHRVTPEELQLIISLASESTGLEAGERELLKNVFDFGDVVVEEVMVPRTNIAAIPSTATFQTLLSELATSGYSRYPAMGDSLDDIRGIIHFKELAKPLASGILTPTTPIEPWIRPARFVQASRPLGELLPLMQQSRQAMVVVVDEFGGTAGLVTLTDLVAEIIGDRPEAEPTAAASVQILGEQTFLVQAQLDVEEVNELLDLDLPIADDYQTLAGFLIYQLQRIPQPGENLQYGNFEFEVVSVNGPRLDRIRVRRLGALPTQEAVEEAIDLESPATPEWPNSSLAWEQHQ